MCFLQFSLAILAGSSLLSPQWQNRGAGGFSLFQVLWSHNLWRPVSSWHSCGAASALGQSHTTSPQNLAFKSHKQKSAQRHRFPQLLFSNFVFVTPDVALIPSWGWLESSYWRAHCVICPALYKGTGKRGLRIALGNIYEKKKQLKKKQKNRVKVSLAVL